MSMFHWHIVDSQSFPLEVTGFPELSAKGAYSPDEIYSVEDVQTIVQYAGSVGIFTYLPIKLLNCGSSVELMSYWYLYPHTPKPVVFTSYQEIDTPGHTDAIAASHPEHIACSQASPWSDFAAEPPSGQLRIASNATISFATELIQNIAKTLPSALFSTGGDELNTYCYEQDAQTQADLRSSGLTLEEALSVFTQATHKPLKNLGKSPVVWEGQSCLLVCLHERRHISCLQKWSWITTSPFLRTPS